MDCREVAELIDGYALGAADEVEAAAIEDHVADCVRCWEELTEAQQAAASLALTVPISDAPARLRERIMRKAEHETSPGAARAGVLSRLRLKPWFAPAASFAAGLGILFAVFQLQVHSLRDDNSDLEQRVATSGVELLQQRQINAVLSASDTEILPMKPASAGPTGSYNWSPTQRIGLIVCNQLPALPDGKVYQAWFTLNDEATPLGTCNPINGNCQFPIDLSRLPLRAEGIGISAEPEGGSTEPTGAWVMYGEFKR